MIEKLVLSSVSIYSFVLLYIGTPQDDGHATVGDALVTLWIAHESCFEIQL